ncbi:MAG: hypothetical protein ABSH12_05695 [Endomicrobiales bacterium]|jgi:hydrogenase-4 component E
MTLFLSGVLMTAFLMVLVKRVGVLISIFFLQSIFLCAITLSVAITHQQTELYFVAALVLVVKVIMVPQFLRRVTARIKVADNLGLSLNPLMSLMAATGLSGLAYLFARQFVPVADTVRTGAFSVSLSVMLIGLFLMIFRMKALAQIIGLLVMENGLFLAAAALCGGMPFFIEIAIFLDLLVCIMIAGIFVYRINALFTHIDVDKLRQLRG